MYGVYTLLSEEIHVGKVYTYSEIKEVRKYTHRPPCPVKRPRL